MHDLRIKRIYEEPSDQDGFRILMDRLWPRGVSKERAALDGWEKAITPSTELRKAFGHMEENMEDFRKKYRIELEANEEKEAFLDRTIERLRDQNVTLLYAAKSKSINHATVLKEWIEEHLPDEA
jgi:uncharacterized protein YeaO (DUF488 family)